MSTKAEKNGRGRKKKDRVSGYGEEDTVIRPPAACPVPRTALEKVSLSSETLELPFHSRKFGQGSSRSVATVPVGLGALWLCAPLSCCRCCCLWLAVCGPKPAKTGPKPDQNHLLKIKDQCQTATEADFWPRTEALLAGSYREGREGGLEETIFFIFFFLGSILAGLQL